MLDRRQFLTRTLQGSSLLALSTAVPQFLANTARAAEPGKDNILVVLEMSGGNDGLNTVIPYADDLYHKARPTLRQTKDVVLRLDDHVGLHSGMQSLRPLWEKGQLAVVQALRRYEYEELREILLLATKHGLPPVLLRDRATDILLTVAACAAL